MPQLMRCPFCGLLQDEPSGVKACSRCGGGLEYETTTPSGALPSYLQVQMELDQVTAPAGQNVERYLLLTLRTPARVPPEEAAPAGMQRPPLSLTAVLDVSGSMRGEKIEHAKAAVRQALRFLHPGDAFSLVTFSAQVACPFPPESVYDDTAMKVEGALQQMTAGGNTALCAGLELGTANAFECKQDNNLVLLLSDGQANEGETDLEKIGMRALHARQQGLLVSTLGVGPDYNEALMTEIATQGGGRFYHIQEAGKIPAFVAGELGEVAALAAREVTVRLSLPPGATLIPLSAAYPVRQEGDTASIFVGDIPCDSELEIPLRLALLANPPKAKRSVEGTLTFTSPAARKHSLPVNRITVRFVQPDSFQLRLGIVQPVAEKVFEQMKASSFLGVSRLRASRPAEADKHTETILSSLEAYSELLGEGRAKEEMHKIREDVVLSAASPAYAKQVVNSANRIMRDAKDFNK